jgi:hypothetical protein
MRTPAASGGTEAPNRSAMAADVRLMGRIGREPKVAPAAVGLVDAASEPDGSPDVDPLVTGWGTSGGVGTRHAEFGEKAGCARNSASMLRSADTSTSASAR